MDKKRVLNKALREFTKYQVGLFTSSKEVILTAKEKESILGIINTLIETEKDGISYRTKIKDKVIKFVLYNDDFRIYDDYSSTPANKIDKYEYNNLIYDTIEKIPNTSEIDKLNDLFNIEKSNVNGNNIEPDNKEWCIKNLVYRSNTLRFTYEKGNYYSSSERLWKFCNDLFPEAKIDKELIKVIDKHKQLYLIVDVKEGKGDYRYIQLYGNNKIIYLVAHPEDDMYNYFDKNRMMFFTLNYNQEIDRYLAFEVTDNHTILKSKVPNYISFITSLEKTTRHFDRFVDDKNVLSSKNKFMLEEMKRKKAEEIAAIKNKKYKEAIEKLHKEVFEKNGIKFSEFSIEYEGIVVDTNKYFSFKKYLSKISVDELVDFNTLLNFVLRSISYRKVFGHDIPSDLRDYRQYSYDCLHQVPIDVVTFTVDKKQISITTDDVKYFINGIRINKAEVPECLTHILCYQTIEAYNKFLETVSSCSMKFHKAISGGIKHSFNAGGTNTTVELKMIRDKSKNYLVLGKKQLQVSDTNRLIDWNGWDYRSFIEMLMNVVSIDFSDIKALLKEGLERYKLALKKSEQLLNETMKALNVTKKTVDSKTGYVVKGLSGNEYLVEDNAKGSHSTYPVWQVGKNGSLNYVCIVDRSSKNQVGKDGLVARLYALYNDKLIASDVHTLKSKV